MEHMGHFKRKGALENAQNVRIYIILHTRSLIREFALCWNIL